jgi:quercetin dioxygenase-like cupin family protein
MMKHGQVVGTLLCCAGIVVGVGIGRLWALQGKVMPQGGSPVVAKVDLAEIGLPGRVSVSHVTIPEGNRMAPHKHDARTSIVTVVKGVVREHRGEVAKEYKVGDVFTVANQTTHYNEAGGTGPAEYIEVNISNNNISPAPAATPTAR